MGQLSIKKNVTLNSSIIEKIYQISYTKKILKVMDEPDEYIILFDNSAFRGENKNITIIPDRLFITNYKMLILSDFIDVSLEYFPNVISKFKKLFPHIIEYMRDEKIELVRIKPSVKITESNKHRSDMGLKDISDMTNILLDPESALFIDSFVGAELVRRFYMGEKDYIGGFVLYKSSLKYVKAIIKDKVDSSYIFDKLETNPSIVDNDNFFKGSDNKYTFQILNNVILTTTKKSVYMDNLDLKFLSTLATIGNLLHEKRFGRRN